MAEHTVKELEEYIKKLLTNTSDIYATIINKVKDDFELTITTDYIHDLERKSCPGRSMKLLSLGRFSESDDVPSWDQFLRDFGSTESKREWLKYYVFKVCQFYRGTVCSHPGCKREAYEVVYIDGNRDNVLLTNLDMYCYAHSSRYNDPVFQMHPCTIKKSFKFDSCHHLLNYKGKCANPHGHTYKMDVSLKSRVNPQTDMVMDFGQLKNHVEKLIIEPLDHFDLSEIFTEFNSTAENMIFWIWETLEKSGKIKGLNKIELWETEGSSAILTAEDVLNTASYIWTFYADYMSGSQ